MLQHIVYSLLIFLTLLAICDVLASCLKTGADSKKKYVKWSAPYYMVKNRLKGMKTLKEEVDSAPWSFPEVEAEAKPPTISETV